MFDIGPGEFALLVVIGILVVGPERLPSMIRQGSRMMRTLRGQIASAKEELTSTVGPQVGEIVDMVGDLNPRRLLGDVAGDVTRDVTGAVGLAAAVNQPSSRSGIPAQSAHDDRPDAPIIDADTP